MTYPFEYTTWHIDLSHSDVSVVVHSQYRPAPVGSRRIRSRYDQMTGSSLPRYGRKSLNCEASLPLSRGRLVIQACIASAPASARCEHMLTGTYDVWRIARFAAYTLQALSVLLLLQGDEAVLQCLHVAVSDAWDWRLVGRLAALPRGQVSHFEVQTACMSPNAYQVLK